MKFVRLYSVRDTRKAEKSQFSSIENAFGLYNKQFLSLHCIESFESIQVDSRQTRVLLVGIVRFLRKRNLFDLDPFIHSFIGISPARVHGLYMINPFFTINLVLLGVNFWCDSFVTVSFIIE